MDNNDLSKGSSKKSYSAQLKEILEEYFNTLAKVGSDKNKIDSAEVKLDKELKAIQTTFIDIVENSDTKK